MLEKIGLPAKPSMRGGNWVLDASHCQGCSSQFTFINRKHHCRRCGGLFCNTCTQQRMVLRGQGDSSVRICDPCKKLEEAARFELRYGHRKRTAKVNTKQIVKSEDEILDQILGNGVKHVSGNEPDNNSILDLQRLSSSASCSNIREESAAPGSEGDIVRSISVATQNHSTLDIMQGDPAELRQQAVEEKKKYKSLKTEGKSEEALQSFKRSKELERQAGVLEIALRKNRRMASKASYSSTSGIQKIDGHEEYGGKEKLPSQKGKGAKNDLAAELRELGWSDADLRDSDKKPANLSLEGELSTLLAEVTPRPAQGAKKNHIDKSEVIGIKKKALLLKREGKLAEAKEELKRAKILEKQLEEQELLGEAEDSDDELYALINAMDDDKQDGLVLDHTLETGLQFDNSFVSDDLPIDGNFEVTDDDMHDPDLTAALKSFGWSEEDEEQSASQGEESVDLEALQKQVLSLKREALSQKRAGNVAEAMELLKKAKLLEKDLEGLQSSSEMFTSGLSQESSNPQARKSVENAAETVNSYFKSQPKSKLMIQKELLALKKKALTLRREGRIDEADEELKKGKVLEQQLEEMENAPRNHGQELRKGKILEQQQEEMEINHSKTIPKAGRKNLDSTHLHADGDIRSFDLGEEALETDVTEQDMQDPALLSILENFGWKESDDVQSVSMLNTTSKHDTIPPVAPRKAKRSKADMQKELLAIKRKALALRRQGNTEAAEEELEKAKALENQMAEMEVSSNVNSMEVESLGSSTLIPPNFSIKLQGSGNTQSDAGSLALVATNELPNDKAVPLENVFDVGLSVKGDKPEASPVVPKMLQSETLMSAESALPAVEIPTKGAFAQQLNQNRKMAELLSGNDDRAFSSMMDPVKGEDKNVNVKPGFHNGSDENTTSECGKLSNTTSDFQNKESNVSKTNSSASPESKLVPGVDAHKDEILARKRKAVALKREGKLAEAREELRQAKLLEKNLEVGQQDLAVKEVVSISTFDNTPIKKESKTSPSEKPMSSRDRFKIQQESLSHKRNALKLRRAGKIDEADAELEIAKSLEKQLEEYDQGSGGKSEATDDVVVEDLLDPQLLSALRAIGLDDTPATNQPPMRAEPQRNSDRRQNHRTEKADLEEQIKAEKLRALQFKREGKQAEALEALRSAKRLEKKHASLA